MIRPYLTKRMEIVTWIVSIPDPRSASLRLRPREALPEANMRGLWPRNWPRLRPSETFCADKSKHFKVTSRRAPTSPHRPRSRTARGAKRYRRTASRNQLKASHTTITAAQLATIWSDSTGSMRLTSRARPSPSKPPPPASWPPCLTALT